MTKQNFNVHIPLSDILKSLSHLTLLSF